MKHVRARIVPRRRFWWSRQARLPPLLVLLACGSTDPAPTPEDPEVAACHDYCEAAADVGCPNHGDCTKDCLAMAGLGCVDLFVDLIRCAGPALTSECVPRDQEGALTCTDQLSGYDSCLPLDFGVPLESCGPSTAESESPASGCHGAIDCGALQLSVTCDAAGTCTCARNGDTVAECASLLSSAYLCAPHRSCCAPVFARI
jgi:hypothetical protein